MFSCFAVVSLLNCSPARISPRQGPILPWSSWQVLNPSLGRSQGFVENFIKTSNKGVAMETLSARAQRHMTCNDMHTDKCHIVCAYCACLQSHHMAALPYVHTDVCRAVAHTHTYTHTHSHTFITHHMVAFPYCTNTHYVFFILNWTEHTLNTLTGHLIFTNGSTRTRTNEQQTGLNGHQHYEYLKVIFSWHGSATITWCLCSHSCTDLFNNLKDVSEFLSINQLVDWQKVHRLQLNPNIWSYVFCGRWC